MSEGARVYKVAVEVNYGQQRASKIDVGDWRRTVALPHLAPAVDAWRLRASPALRRH